MLLTRRIGCTGTKSMKNPFMSLWLSAANRAAAHGSGIWKAAVRRQQTTALNEANKAMMAFWTSTPKKPRVRKPTKRT
jgi:hypothetical protein